MPSSHYIHGSHEEEQARLSRLNDLINGLCLRELALTPGRRILDVGCGLGQLSRAMARAVAPGGKVVGIERDPAQLAEAARQAAAASEESLVDFRPGDALALPLTTAERASFDVAHARFILEHVPDPIAVVKQMLRAVRPGGRLVLADDDHDLLRLWPEPAGLAPLWDAYCRTYTRLGNDPFIGRKLVQLLHDAGARPLRNTTLFFGACAGHADFHPLVTNMLRILEGARPTIVQHGPLDDEHVRAGIDSLRAWSTRPDAALWFVICWAEAVAP